MSRANIFMNAGWVGLAGILVVVASHVFAVPEGTELVGSIIAVFACWTMLFTRNADEYTSGLWTSAASLAFGTVLILFLALPFFEGVYDGFNAAHEGRAAGESTQDIPAMLSITAAIGAFYLGLFWKRLRGGM